MMKRAKSTFFERLVIALPYDVAEKICRIEAGVDTSGMSRVDINYALIAADKDAKKTIFVREAVLEFIRNVL